MGFSERFLFPGGEGESFGAFVSQSHESVFGVSLLPLQGIPDVGRNTSIGILGTFCRYFCQHSVLEVGSGTEL